jgi:hypothetical protein
MHRREAHTVFEKKLFGSRIDPSCRYCGHGTPTQDGAAVLCGRRGVMSPTSHCRRFLYDPLSRIPLRQPELPRFDPSDFEL